MPMFRPDNDFEIEKIDDVKKKIEFYNKLKNNIEKKD